MKPRVMIGPAQLKGIEPVYAPTLQNAGFELVFPKKNLQMVEDEVLEQVPGCVASLAGSEPYNRTVIARLAAAGLKVIARAGVGYDGVDTDAATEHGVAVTIAPGTNQDAVAEHTFMMMLALAKNLVNQHTQIRAGKWPRKVTLPLRGKTLGVVGYGRIGKSVSVRGKAFGMTVLAHDPFADEAFAAQHDVKLTGLEELLRASDYVTLHIPMLPGTKEIISARTIELMKPTAFLINTARGGVVNEPELYAALKAGRLAGAGLDVLEEEPPPADHPLLTLDNVLFTAHTAGIDTQGRDDMARMAATAIVRLLSGDWPEGWVVNPAVRSKWKI